MKKLLYPRQREILDFIIKFKEVNDCWPTLNEVRYSFQIDIKNILSMAKKEIIKIERRKFSVHKTVIAIPTDRYYKLSSPEQKVVDFLKTKVASFAQLCEAKVIKPKSSSALYILVSAGLVQKIYTGTYELSPEGRKYVS